MLLYSVILYASLGLCAAAIGWTVRRYDLHDREPPLMLVGATVLGALMMGLAMAAQDAVVPALMAHGGDHSNLRCAALAGTTEELAKLLSVLLIALCFPRIFNDPLDGVVYGSFVGLGAALIEAYCVIGTPSHLVLPCPEEFIRLLGHLVMGGIGCAALGALSVRPAALWFALPAGLALAIGIHVAWDVIAYSAADAVRAPWLAGAPPAMFSAVSAGVMFVGLLAYRAAVQIASLRSKAMFQPNAAESLASGVVRDMRRPSTIFPA